MAIHHIVLVKFKPETTAEQKAAWTAGGKDLIGDIPQLKDVKIGKKIARPDDGGWDNGFIGVFDNLEDLKTYNASVTHVKFIKEMEPFIAEKLIFDLEA